MIQLNIVSLSLLCLFYTICSCELSPLVHINQGKLRGVVKKDWKGGDFYSFLSIPYARKPIGNLRFMIPAAPEKWEGILDATEDLPMCVQKDFMGNFLGQEDCLYLNVHTPELQTKDLKPVMVFIHGGGFVEGHGRNDMFGAEFLMPEGVLLVTIHYRLGLFGFLNFENSEIGVFGNMGLKDQSMALRWVKKNIEKFGGDPNSVTIFGESAGGCSVHLHLLSPMSQGLFHKVIAHSGSALNAWCVGGQKDTGKFAAKVLAYDGKSEMKMLPFLQKASVKDIMKVQENITIMIEIHELALARPIVENIEDDLAFLPKSAEELIASKEYKEVPFMLGLTNEEGILTDVVSFLSTGKQMEFRPEQTLLRTLNLKTEEEKKEAMEEIKNFYTKISKESDRPSQLWIAGDAWLNYQVHKSLVAHGKRDHKDLYFYVFSADTELNYFKNLHAITTKYKGAAHIDDLGYIFKTKLTPDFNPDSIEAKSMQRVVKLWTNFAKYGNPTPKDGDFGVMWKPVEEGALNFMTIGTDSLKLDQNPFAERIAFWEKLHEKYADGRKDIHTEL